MNNIRIHTKDSKALLDYLGRNERNFQVEKTSSGFPTYNYAGKSIYIRDKVVGRGSLNKILLFQNQVAKSNLYKFVDRYTVKEIETESTEIERSLSYKGFTFNPHNEESFEKVIKIDFNTAYWQTCRYFRMISREMYKDVATKCTKTTRLRITGTLGKRTMVTDYVKGRKEKAYVKEETKKRVVFQNVYNRVRKFVDELMVWCYKRNPSNFIGYYVDCVWLREYDAELIEKLNTIFKLKTEIVDLEVIKNNHSKMIIIESSDDSIEAKVYDAQFKYNEFVIYKNLYNFTLDLEGINLKVK